MRKLSVWALIAPAVVCLALVRPASAQWTVTNLSPGSGQSGVSGAYGNIQVGCAFAQGMGVQQAGMWSSTTNSWVDLQPASGVVTSNAYGADDTQEIGEWTTNRDRESAIVWNGSSSSYVDLTPTWASEAYGCGISGNTQVGCVGWPGRQVVTAALWHGTSASVVDLNPNGDYSSTAWATDGDQQVGWTMPQSGGATYAALWNGTSDSYVNLNPAGSSGSTAQGVYGGWQCGENGHALLWNGTSASCIDINPTGAVGSGAMAMCKGVVAGYVGYGSYGHAGVWISADPNGYVDMADNFVDLGVPDGYLTSQADAVGVANGNIYVSGYAMDASHNLTAFLWTYTPVPEPSSLLALALGAGALLPIIRKRK